jgi:uncharacterized phage protein (TIGR01671 family)
MLKVILNNINMEKSRVKFRIWNGSVMEYNIMVGFLGTFYVQGMDEKDSACMSNFNTKYSDKTPLMQFTGLKDKNGKEIYESDILLKHYGSTDPKVSVEWSNERAMFIQADGYNEALHNLNMDYIEVIGNVYEEIK